MILTIASFAWMRPMNPGVVPTTGITWRAGPPGKMHSGRPSAGDDRRHLAVEPRMAPVDERHARPDASRFRR